MRIVHPFVLRSFQPAPQALIGKRVTELRRVGKRIALGIRGRQWLVLHLMIAGRLHWFAAGAQADRARRAGLLRIRLPARLTLTEAGTKRRASLYVVAEPRQRCSCTIPAAWRF